MRCGERPVGKAADGVDFRAARRRVEALSDVPAESRQRAFACWVGLFDLADDKLVVAMASRRLVEELGVSRMAWTLYRRILEDAGLLRAGVAHRGPHPQLLEIVVPT